MRLYGPLLGGVLAMLAIAGIATPALAQDDTNAQILGKVDSFFRGLNTKDAALMASVVHEQSVIASVIEREGPGTFRTNPIGESIRSLTETERTFREVYWDPIVLVNGPVAVVWAPYSFDRDGNRSHCGIDVFNLMRIEGEWKITGVQYSVEPDNCPKGR